MARFEAALALAGARVGIVPAGEAAVIAQVCAALRWNAAELVEEARRAATLAVPFVRRLTQEVAKASAAAARYVHLGATSQDVIDTGLVLCLRPATARVLELCASLGDAAAALAEKHAATPMLARTLLQPAIPVPFGWKVATWLAPFAPGYLKFADAAKDIQALQFGGAGGTLAAYGERGEALTQALADELQLQLPPISWHSARDRVARLGAEAAVLTGLAAKIARDVSLLMQPEVGELAEAGAGGSSAMPHKRNPARCLLALEAAQRAPGLAATLLGHLTSEHERGLGQWQSQRVVLRDLLAGCANGLAAMADLLGTAQVDAAAMRANIERTRGLAFSEAVSLHLARTMGKAAAYAATEKLCERVAREGITLRDAASTQLNEAELDGLFRPENHYGDAPRMIERTIAAWRATRRGTAT
ncbi:MAG: lyase family protein [Betaproteobacteria bacterium]